MVLNNIERGQGIHLFWLDSCVGSGWVYDDLEAHPKEIESLGFVCDVTPDAVMITSTRSSSGGVVSPLTIPAGCIHKYSLLEL